MNFKFFWAPSLRKRDYNMCISLLWILKNIQWWDYQTHYNSYSSTYVHGETNFIYFILFYLISVYLINLNFCKYGLMDGWSNDWTKIKISFEAIHVLRLDYRKRQFWSKHEERLFKSYNLGNEQTKCGLSTMQ